jgi:hypothetical protein
VTGATLSFANGAVAFAVYALAALVALRLPGRWSPVARKVVLALLVHVGATGVALRMYGSLPYWHGAAVYWCGFVLSLFLYSAVYKSISLTILADLAKRADHGLSLHDITTAHVWPSFVARARILVAAGYVAEAAGAFRATDAGRRLARRVAVVQRLFGVRQSGLYGFSE